MSVIRQESEQLKIMVPHLSEAFLTKLFNSKERSLSSGMEEIFEMHRQDMKLVASPEELEVETYSRVLIWNFEVEEPELETTGYDTLEEMHESEQIFELFCRSYVREYVEELSVSHPLVARKKSSEDRLYFELEATIAPDGRDTRERLYITIGYFQDQKSNRFGIDFLSVSSKPVDEAVLTKWILSLS